MKTKYFLIGAGLSALICGVVVLLFNGQDDLEKWMMPFGVTMFGMAFIKDLN
ncbi:hypothetical protein IB292_02375 [Vibrio parahaemolyticus]|jgi:hypothetical protein|uniref:Uncharacterized protein n=2 Tax=Vibrio harveyi group TaxID=717610 RepID=A0A9Q3UBP9_VIBPH|nr:hypothetical protein [Vibrio parahaemolyticus]ELA8176813.1 hypothetical protein [Vibrio alginolyticus]MCC3803875.1 hypothetical protein [Vibrio parahaemolyticus]CAH1593027.1 hypothetical protein THF1C08_320090 [Vibrio jasicida]CAH1597531.1 hypothetical protein THF1A12_320090 [Vibrio jasicida]